MGSNVDVAVLAEAIASLQRRVAKLELATNAPASVAANDRCSECKGIQILTDERAHPTAARFKVRTFTCTKCGRVFELDWSEGD